MDGASDLIDAPSPKSKPPRPIVILGSTAGGKSELAAQLAQHVGGQVIGADSMQVYRHLNAGTAKPDEQLLCLAKHHLIDIVEPTERFTVSDWLKRVDALIPRLQAEGLVPIIVGGTNLYLKALLEGLFAGPSHDPDLRASLAVWSGDELHDRLRLVDPEAAARIHRNDRKKLVRALEVNHVTQKPISALQQQWERRGGSTGRGYRHDPILIGLMWSTETINRRINQRVTRMFFPGQKDRDDDCTPGTESLPQEVRRLEEAGMLGLQAREALGYKQVLAAQAGRCTLDDAYEKTKILTRRFAKNQRTWHKRFQNVHWINAEDGDAQQRLARCLMVWRQERALK